MMEKEILLIYGVDAQDERLEKLLRDNGYLVERAGEDAAEKMQTPEGGLPLLLLTQRARKELKKMEVNGLEVDDATKTVTVDGRKVNLTPTEFKILRLLMETPGQVISNHEIYESIWKMAPIGADNTVAVHIRHIREKIEDNPQEPRFLKVVWGQGYKVG